MAWFELFIKLIDAVIWPFVALVALMMFRRPILAVLPKLKKLKYKEFEADFSETLRQMKQSETGRPPAAATMDSLVAAPGFYSEKIAEFEGMAPNAVVIDSWRILDQAAREMIIRRNFKLPDGGEAPYKAVEQVIAASGLVAEDDMKKFGELRRLRNKIVHADGYEIDRQQAEDYRNICAALVSEFERLSVA